MPKQRSAKRNRDGIVVRDQHAMKGKREGSRWLYRAWDSAAERYRSKAFDNGPDDEGRRQPGCAAGDAWAKAQAQRFGLGLDSAAVASLRTVAEQFLATREQLGRSAGHLQAIRWTVAKAGEAGLDDLSDRTLPARCQRWLGRLTAQRPGQRSATPASARVRNHHLAILRSVAAFGVRRRLVVANPFLAVDRFDESRRHRPVYTLAELREMVSEAHRADPWWPFAMLAVYTGARSETLRSITWAMVDWSAGKLRIPAELMKANADLRATIQAELRAVLEAAPGVGSATILPPGIAGLTSDATNERMQAYLERIGIEPNGRSVHAIRHSHASLLVATGLSSFLTMDRLGHSSTQTSKHYSAGADEFRDAVRAEGWTEGELFLRRAPPAQVAKAKG